MPLVAYFLFSAVLYVDRDLIFEAFEYLSKFELNIYANT